jgi:AmiR/NasT family two-component response regulator
LLAEQLQSALNSRVIVEQAKGVLAQRGELPMHEAFNRLRTYARSHNLRLSEVARQVIETDLGADVLSASARAKPPSGRR